MMLLKTLVLALIYGVTLLACLVSGWMEVVHPYLVTCHNWCKEIIDICFIVG